MTSKQIKLQELGPVKDRPQLSVLDKRILVALLSSKASVSSNILSEELGVPSSTIHRRRRKLESRLLNRSYTMNVEILGLRTAELFISTKNGATSAVARELLELRNTVLSVWRTMSESGIDLEVLVMFRNHEELANILEFITSMDAVNKVHWHEHIKVIGKNNYPHSIISNL